MSALRFWPWGSCGRGIGFFMSRLEHPDRLKCEEYRAKAVAALERAAKAKAADMRDSWETIAKSYQDMAERLERNFKS